MKPDVARLDTLFKALRLAGLRVGVLEMSRCRQVCERWGEDGSEITPARWRSLLATVLVRNPEERQTFERVFDGWLGPAELEPQKLEIPVKETRVGPPERPLWLGLSLVGVLLASFLPAVLVPVFYEGGREGAKGSRAAFKMEAPSLPVFAPEALLIPLSPEGATDIPGAVFADTRAAREIPEAPWPGWAELLTALLLVAWAGKVVADLKQRVYLPEPAEPAREEGLARVLLGARDPEPPILEEGERDAVAWGVGRYLSEEKTPQLDLQATVGAIAEAGGRLELRFESARFQREVWLWLDQTSRDPNLRRLADEVEKTLGSFGLPCERALFRGVPSKLFAVGGRRFRPHEVDERRREAIVVILSDGQLLDALLRGHDRAPVEAAFRELGAWPRLGLFLSDEAPPSGRELARRHQIEVKTPAELASFLAGARLPRRVAGRDLKLWRAACALVPTSLAENMAIAVARQRKLVVGPWQLDQLRAEAAAATGRLEWKDRNTRRELVEWLRSAEKGEENHFDAALLFWIEGYERELVVARQEPAFVGSLAERLLAAELALLQLFLRGKAGEGERGKAIDELYRIHQGTPALRPFIEAKLGELDVASTPPERIRLDFTWSELSPARQLGLSLLGLGGRKVKARLRPPGRPRFLVALLAGLACGLLGRLWLQPAHPPRVAEGCRPQEKKDEWGIDMVRVCGGTFWMGTRADPGAKLAGANEKPAHQVTLSEFWMDKCEVTDEQYLKLRPATAGRQKSTLPVTGVDWTEAATFCAARGGRLPTEAEWEYAARAGTRTPWSSGANEVDLATVAWYGENSGRKVRPVGQKQPNGWGLYDLHGNVWEWTATDYEKFSSEPRVNPVPSRSVVQPVVRGGSYRDESWGLRSAYRGGDRPGHRGKYLGFRCVRFSRPVLGPLSPRPISSPDEAQPEKRLPLSGSSPGGVR